MIFTVICDFYNIIIWRLTQTLAHFYIINCLLLNNLLVYFILLYVINTLMKTKKVERENSQYFNQ